MVLYPYSYYMYDTNTFRSSYIGAYPVLGINCYSRKVKVLRAFLPSTSECMCLIGSYQ